MSCLINQMHYTEEVRHLNFSMSDLKYGEQKKGRRATRSTTSMLSSHEELWLTVIYPNLISISDSKSGQAKVTRTMRCDLMHDMAKLDEVTWEKKKKWGTEHDREKNWPCITILQWEDTTLDDKNDNPDLVDFTVLQLLWDFLWLSRTVMM